MLAVPGCEDAWKRVVRKPNIIFIMADDLGYKELGCYGQQKIKTPHIDRLAAEGMRFTQYYTGSAVCAPARCNLMTGKHGGHAYVRNNSEIGSWDSFRGQLPLPANTATVANLLKQQGYVAGAFGKWGLGEVGSTGDPLNQGFDRFFGYNCQRHAHNLYPRYLVSDRQKVTLEGNTRGLTGKHYAPQAIADEMLKFIRENKDRPFFLYYPTVLPHLALQVPEEDLNQYKGKWPETPYNGKSYLALWIGR
jgi:arylsulfatase